MRRLAGVSILLLWLAVPGSVWAQAAEDARDADEPGMSVEEILTRDPDEDDYGDTPRCVRTSRIREIDVIDDQHVAFQVSRSEYYLVQFEHRCPGLRRGKPVIYEPSGGNRLCVLDGIRATYDNGLGGVTPGMRCAISGFESVTKEQLVLLKDALKAERRKKRDA